MAEPQKPENTSRLGTTFVNVVITTGVVVFVRSIEQLLAAPVGSQWFILLALSLLTGSFTIGMSSLSVRISVSETFVFASVLLFGPASGVITVVLETLVISFWLRPQNRAPHRVMFNAAALAIAIWVSGTVFFWFSGIAPYYKHASPLSALFIPLAVFTTLYFLLNTWLVAFAVAFHKGISPWKVWWPQFTWFSVNYFSGASVAALIVTYSQRIDISTLLVIVPLLVISYLTFRTAMGRVDDATHHLSQLNRLYLSTIETLAMAIDAKDQITHGHIRRVQTYAVALAKRVGVADEQLIQAIEAASLLHDMGKLAVPEYILNKPGRLTEAEFEKMKLHASVGADILSAIEFPYPVVPIVRHHHENWDGSGYPDGLRATEIPIGARILSVVDCFDALTSDRPYRPRLADDEALAVLIQRRGTMYDPLIVDTFISVQKQLSLALSESPAQRAALNEIASSTQAALTMLAGSDRLDQIAASSDEGATFRELASALSSETTLTRVGDVIAKQLMRLVPFSLMVVFVYDSKTDELEAIYTAGETVLPVKTMRIELGRRLSGWVAANRQTIINSDPVLDLGEAARQSVPRLRSCLSTPIVANDAVVGVLSLYSSSQDPFSDEHQRLIETVASHSASTFARILVPDGNALRDSLLNLPYIDLTDNTKPALPPIAANGGAVLWIRCVGLTHVASTRGRSAANETLLHAARCIQSELRSSDSLYRVGQDEFIAIIASADLAGAVSIAERVSKKLREPLSDASGSGVKLDVMVKCISTPTDSRTLRDKIDAAAELQFRQSVRIH